MCGSIEKLLNHLRYRKSVLSGDYLQIYRLLFNPTLVARSDTVSVADAVIAVKRWFHGQAERSLVVLDSTDAIDNSGGDDQSYLNLGFFLSDARSVDVIITTRHTGVGEMMTLAAVEVGEMETTEAAVQPPDVNTEVLQIVSELGKARASNHVSRILYRSNAMVEIRHPLVSTGVSRTTETFTEHEGK